MKLPRLQANDLPLVRRWPLRLIAAAGSLQLAVALIATLVGVLAWATLVESRYGGAAAHSDVYDAGWFTAIGALLAVNVLCAVVIRFPWRRKQTGFVVTHLGILVLLAGCLATRLCGVEAQLSIFEGRAAHLAYLDSDRGEVDFGFQVYLHRFRRKLDPGAGMASHYSSLVDFLDRGDPPKKLAQEVLITLNAPVDFSDPLSGRTYRLFQSSFEGPWLPGEPEFDRLVHGDRSRDQVYLSRLSVNYDPGRGLKYAGCLLIVVGIAIVYYLRPGSFSRRACPPCLEAAAPYERGGQARPLHVIVLLMAFAAAPGVCRAEDNGGLDWSTWRRIPAFGQGRVEPLDTFARETVAAICGRPDPTLALPGAQPRKFTAAELLFSWLAEPEKWESVPFLAVQDQQLRQEVLGLALYDQEGRRLRYATPGEVENSAELGRRWTEIQTRADEDKNYGVTGLEKQIKALVDAYSSYRLLTFNPNSPKVPPQRFYAAVRRVGDAWRKLAGDLQGANRISRDGEVRRLMVQAGEALQKLITQVHGGEFSRANVETPVVTLCQVGDQLAARLADPKDKPLCALAANLRRQGLELHLALYDDGETLRLAPALDPAALEENRTPGDDAAPWLSFQAMIFGSDDLLRGYPQPELKAVRRAWASVKAAYLDRGAADRSARFAVAMDRFAEAVRALGEQIGPLRQKLPIQHPDQDVMDATAYPPPGSTDVEVFYNRLDPFFWSWVVSLAATLVLLLAVGRWRRPMFWLGVAVLIVAQAFTAAGMGLRGYVTGLVPLTGMFETVVFVALYAAMLGLWFTLRPSIKPRPAVAFQNATAGRGFMGARMDLVFERRLFAVAGAIVSCVAVALAYYAPASVMHRNLGAVAPILRDNFWLAVHVVTIMASYASAAIALILGNIALGYYLLGHYVAQSDAMSTLVVGMAPATRLGHRPPAACPILAGLIYTAIQITVLLLAAGTILGALWADKAWGRFWAWDPKEVWALISLLVYLLILHARYIGWSGDFGMIVAAVAGATAVLFTWYGVNFLLGSGMHSYGSGAGGGWAVGAVVAIQWLFLVAAGVRYRIETGGRQ